MKIKPYILKPVAFVVILSFLFQDVVWANPDIGSPQTGTLQVPTGLQPFIDQESFDKTLLKLPIETILRSTDIESFGYRITTPPLTGDLEGFQIDMDFSPPDNNKSTGKIKNKDGWVIPCVIVDRKNGLHRKYDVFVKEDRSFDINEPVIAPKVIEAAPETVEAIETTTVQALKNTGGIADSLADEPVRGYFKTRKVLAAHGITVKDIDKSLARENFMQSFSGIRGIFGISDTISAAHSFITSLYAYQYISRVHEATGKSDLVFVIGRDTRSTGKAIRDAQIRGFIAYAKKNDVQLHFIDLGVVPKPVLFNSVKKFAADGGVMITASHDPDKYNGYEYLNGVHSANRPGAIIAAEESRKLIESFTRSMDMIKRGNEPAVSAIFGVGERWIKDVVTDTAAVEEAVDSYVDFVKLSWGMDDPAVFADFTRRMSDQNVKVVLDTNGGTASGFYAEILKRLGFECVEINTTIVSHSMNPDGEDDGVPAVQDAIDAVSSTKAAFAMVFDCDAGRGLPVIRLGAGKSAEKLKPQEMASFNTAVRLLWLKYIGAVKDGKKPVVVSSDATSFITQDVAKGLGAEVVYCETGETNVISAMKAQADKGYMIALGVEGGNGGTIFGEAPCRDGVLTTMSVALALVYPELRRDLPDVSQKAGLDKSLEGLRDRLPQRSTINFRKEMFDIPPMSELAIAAENVFKERYWPYPERRFLRYEIQYTKDKDCVVNNSRHSGKGMPSGDFGWKVIIYDKNNKASFAWMRLSQTVPNTMRFIVDSGDPELAGYLSKMLENIFDSAVKRIKYRFSLRKVARFLKNIFAPSDLLVGLIGPAKPYNKDSAKLAEVLKELRKDNVRLARKVKEAKAAAAMEKRQREENIRMLDKYRDAYKAPAETISARDKPVRTALNQTTTMIVAGIGMMNLGAAWELSGQLTLIGVIIAFLGITALLTLSLAFISSEPIAIAVKSFISKLPIIGSIMRHNENLRLIEMLEDIYNEEYMEHNDIKYLVFSNTGRGMFTQSIHTEGLLKIFKALKKERPGANTFFDFGSGDGRVAILAGIFGFKASGVEWSKELTDFSNSVLDRFTLEMYREGIYRDLDVSFERGNAMNAISSDHDIIFLALKGSPDMSELQDRVNSLARNDAVVVAYHPKSPFTRLEPLYRMMARYPTIFDNDESSTMLYGPKEPSSHTAGAHVQTLSDLYITSQAGMTKLMIHDLGNTLLYVTLIVDQVRQKTEKTDPNFSEYCADIVEKCKDIALYGTEAFNASEKNNFKDARESQERFSAAVRELSYMAASYQEQKIGNIYYSTENGLSEADNKRLRKYFNNVMKYITFLSPDISIKGAPCDVHDVLDAVMAAEIEKDYIYEKDTASAYAVSLPGVICDRMDLFRIITNILRNAKQSQAGQDERASVRPETSSDGEFVKIVIKDNGPGMTPEQVESFNNDRDVDSTKGPGRGQGLRAVRLLVAKNGGTVEVSSERFKGTTFTIRLPAVRGLDKSVYGPPRHGSEMDGGKAMWDDMAPKPSKSGIGIDSDIWYVRECAYRDMVTDYKDAPRVDREGALRLIHERLKTEPDSRVREMMISTIGFFGDKNSVPVLEQVVLRRYPCPEGYDAPSADGSAAVEAIARIGGTEALAALGRIEEKAIKENFYPEKPNRKTLADMLSQTIRQAKGKVEALSAIGFSSDIASTGSRSAEVEELIRRLSTPEKQNEAKDLASRSLVYRFIEDDSLRIAEEKRIIPKDAMTYIRNGNEVVISEGYVAIVELKDGESIVTPGLNSCAALVARGKNKAGRDIYVLTHILPVIIHEQANAIAKILRKHLVGPAEVYIAGESPYEEPFNDLLMTVKKGLNSEGAVTNIDPVRNIWRDRGEVDDVLVTKSGFKAIRSNGADQERSWQAPALPAVLKTEHFNLPVVSRKDPTEDSFKVVGVQLPEGDFLHNTQAMEEIVTGMALWDARKPDIVIFPESMDDIYSIHLDPAHRIETLQRVVDDTGIAIGYFMESQFPGALGKLNMTYTILRPGLEPLTFKKFKWESENRVFDIGGKKAAILICKESDRATSIPTNEVSRSPLKKADVILVAAGTDMPGSGNWPRELSIMYRKPSVFVNFGGPKGLLRPPSSFVFSVEDNVHSKVELPKDAILYADVRSNEPGVAEDIPVRVIDEAARERAANNSDDYDEEEYSGSVSPGSVAVTEADSPLGTQIYTGTPLRDLTAEDQLVQTMVEKIISIAFTKKVVLAFDSKLGGMHSAKLRAIFEVIEELKKDPKFEKFLRTRNIEVLPRLTDVDKFAGVDTAEVFVFTGDAAAVPVAGNVHTAIVNEKDFPADAYYPLAEIVAISLSNFLDSNTLSKAVLIAKELNIDSIVESDGRLVFTLLPSAKEHELQELVRRYARLKDLLRNA